MTHAYTYLTARRITFAIVALGAGLWLGSDAASGRQQGGTPVRYTRYLAEGAGGETFDTRLALVNPSARAADVLLVFSTADGARIHHRMRLAPMSRATFAPESIPALATAQFSTTIHADEEVVVDRTMSWGNGPYGMHGGASISAPARVWVMGEAPTRAGFNLFYLLQNPNDVAADVDIAFVAADRIPGVAKKLRIAPHSRLTLWVNEEARRDPAMSALGGADVAAVVSSSVPIVAERTLYLQRGEKLLGAGESAAAAIPASRWYFAEGSTAGAFDTYLTFFNPNALPASIDVEYLLPSGPPIAKQYSLNPNGTLKVLVTEEDARLANTPFAVVIASAQDTPIVAGRSVWWPRGSAAAWHAGHGSSGATVAAPRWAVAEGEIGSPRGLETQYAIANTSRTGGPVNVTLLFEDGTTVEKLFAVAAMSRMTVDVAREFPEAAGKRFGAVIESRGQPSANLVVEWTMLARGNGYPDAGANALASPLSRRATDADSARDRREAAASGTASPTATAAPAGAVYNLRIATDASPDVTDLEGLIHSTTARWTTARDKVWALYYWSHILKRQSLPIVRHGLEVTDPIRNLADFGFTMCSTIAGINQTLYEAIGLRHQYWDICNHSVVTVEFDGKFNMIDSSMSNLVTLDDGVTLASLEEAAANGGRLVRERSLYSTSPDGFLTGSDTARHLSGARNPSDGTTVNGFADAFCADGLKYRDYYYNWDAGHRQVLNLRDDESYTRYYRRLGEGPDYYVPSEKIAAPDPNDTFENDSENRFGLRGNGSWTFTPDLSAEGWAAAAYTSTNIAPVTGGIRPATAGAPADVIYKVQSANAIASQQVSADFSRTDAASSATISLSRNHGLTWTQIGSASTLGSTVPVEIRLREQVSGAYETLIRIRMTSGSAAPEGIALTMLRINTMTHVNAKSMPRLNIGRNEIFIGTGSQTDTMVLWPELRGDFWRKDAYDSSNIASQPVDVPQSYTALVFPADLSQDAHLVYRMEAPADITRIVYGGRLLNRTPGSYIDFLHSFDGGATWTRSYRLSDTAKPYDVIHDETVTDVPAGVRTVLFKYFIHNTDPVASRASGFYSLRMEANHRPPPSTAKPLDVTFRWKEVGADRTLVERSHRTRITEFPTTYVVNVGGADHPVMESMRLTLADDSDTTPFGYGDGTDVGGAKYVHQKRTEGVHLAKNKAYTLSRPPNGFQSSPGPEDTTILTDGVVGSPVTGSSSYWWGQCWGPGSPVDMRVDLGQTRSAGAFRAHLFGYPFWDALKGEVEDVVEVQTSIDGVDYVSRGFLNTSLRLKDVPANYMLQDDERATAWNFELALASPVSARYVRYRLTPMRTTCISEVQALDRVAYEPFDMRIALPGTTVPPPPVNVPPIVAMTSPAANSRFTAPGPITLAAEAQDPDGAVIRVDFLANTTLIGSTTTSPYSIVWRTVAAGEYSLTARAVDSGGATTTSGPVPITVDEGDPTPGTTPEIVLYAARAAIVNGGWRVVDDTTAAGGKRITHPDAGAARIATPLASPTHYFELSFSADAGQPYRLWIRGKADRDLWSNDSVHVQFDGAVDSSGRPVYRIGSAASTEFNLEACSGCGLSGWGWEDNGWGSGVMGPVLYFQTGPQRIRIQTREDGLSIDQIVLSSSTYLQRSPGLTQNDSTILAPRGDAPPPSNTPPSVTLTRPAAQSRYTAPATIELAADAQDADGSIQRVDFFANSTIVGSVSSSPYATTWRNVPAGEYTLTARATDNAGAMTTSAAIAVTVDSTAPPPGTTPEVVLYAARASTMSGAWRVVADSSAAGGQRIAHPDARAARVASPMSQPLDYFELTFTADAGKPYRLWIRGKADGDLWSNDSVYVQFDGSVDQGGQPIYRIGTTTATQFSLEACSGCGLSGWGWEDNGWGAGVMGPLLYFQTTGTQRIRIQTREDGLSIDQIVVSSSAYAQTPPGPTKNDTTILAATGGGAPPPPPPPSSSEVVLYAARATTIAGGWRVVADGTAAGGQLLVHPDAAAARISTALAAPTHYVELTFNAQAGRAYRLWIRGRSERDSWSNDSVHVQFDGTIGANGQPVYRIGTTSATEFNLEACSGCGLSRWGWEDNGWGSGVMGPLLYFQTSGPQRIRLQTREDGLSIDQIVLSSSTYLQTSPGRTKDDTTILAAAESTSR